ncbi:unnamed protein product [Lymnaea stagnalis]|uniref:Phosphate transporter n=1 Tax=Lymnaea stagnalis TaxID=6523 RepID=A0AAV2HM23_LYMST
MSNIPDDWLWIVVVAFIISFLLAFGIGANDVANTFGTSVGSRVITLLKACILASIFEILGAVLIGYRVSDTIRKGIIDVEPYNNSEKLLLMGNLSALTGSCIWMFLATFFRLPVSATHSIVGATVGFSLVARGSKGVGWFKLGLIVASWFISPVMAGAISAALFWLVRKFVLSKEKPLEPGLKLLPIFYAATIFINAISIFLDGSVLLSFDKIPLYGTFIISIGLALITGAVVRFCVVPWMRRRILDAVENDLIKDEKAKQESTDESDHLSCCISLGRSRNKKKKALIYSNGFNGDSGCKYAETVISEKLLHNDHAHNGNYQGDLEQSPTPVDSEKTGAGQSTTQLVSQNDGCDTLLETEPRHTKKPKRAAIVDKPETKSLFSFLQILTAVFGAFAHGGNDVSNAIGPLVAVWMISNEHSVAQKAPTPIWILLYGGAGISVGLWILGRRVIKTMGEDLSKITPSSGFCIEIGAAMTVLIASHVGIPISTTHCKVGSIVFTGRVRSNDNVDWSLFRNILIAWVVTLPASGAISALMMYLLKEFVPGADDGAGMDLQNNMTLWNSNMTTVNSTWIL